MKIQKCKNETKTITKQPTTCQAAPHSETIAVQIIQGVSRLKQGISSQAASLVTPPYGLPLM